MCRDALHAGRRTHHDAALDAAHAHHRVVRLRPARGGVDHDPDWLPDQQRQKVRLEHHQDVLLAEDLLQAVEGEPRELALDEVGAWAYIYTYV